MTELRPWEVREFAWGTAVKHKKGEYTNLFLRNGEEITLDKYEAEVSSEGFTIYLREES